METVKPLIAFVWCKNQLCIFDLTIFIFSSQWIPQEFAVKHLNKDHEVVKLQTLDGRIWVVNYKFPSILRGWRKFVKESGLEVGDVCAFEMIDYSCFKVHNLTYAKKGIDYVN